MHALYPTLLFAAVFLAWDLSGQAELAIGIPPIGDGLIPWTSTLSHRPSCDQKDTKTFTVGKSCSMNETN
jgi:hypothetical protein